MSIPGFRNSEIWNLDLSSKGDKKRLRPKS
jgi:hypothetical protein